MLSTLSKHKGPPIRTRWYWVFFAFAAMAALLWTGGLIGIQSGALTNPKTAAFLVTLIQTSFAGLAVTFVLIVISVILQRRRQGTPPR